MSADIFARVTAQLIEHLEAGANPWRRTWKTDGSTRAQFGQHRNAVTGRPYRGLNTIILDMHAAAMGYRSLGWITPRAAMAAGFNIKGTHCVQITFWKQTVRTVKGDDGEDEQARGLVCKVYNVLNIDQLEGQDVSGLKGLSDAPVVPMTRTELAAGIERGLGLRVVHAGDGAFYSPGFDLIQIPALPAFESEEAYCATLSHEAIHATGAKTRLAREFGKRFGDEAYAFEELVAEIGAAFVGAVTGHSNEVPNHAGYLASWLRVLKSDHKAILTAASKAQAAADMVLACLAVESTEEEDIAA